VTARPERRVEPEPVEDAPRLAAVPALPPEPKPDPEPVAEQGHGAVAETAGVPAFTSANHTAREWNLWELERAARDHGSDDVAQAEERSYLLVYLREFAGPDGMLPADFDGLVRDAFGDVLYSVGA
jgi:hypothetical protein